MCNVCTSSLPVHHPGVEGVSAELPRRSLDLWTGGDDGSLWDLGGGGRDCRTGGKQPGRKMDMRNLFAQEGRGFPSYQQFWLVHPEISAGYVGVSYSSLECVHAHESRPTLPLQRHIAKKFITVQTVVSLGTAPICLPGVG